MSAWLVVEKDNPLAVHAHCVSRESAQRWIDIIAPEHCKRGYFMDKALTPESFTIVEKAPCLRLPKLRLHHYRP